MIQTLTDIDEFRLRRESAWTNNVDYWLRQPLRHVEDVGDIVVDRLKELVQECDDDCPTVIDMGFGSAWLLQDMVKIGINCNYIGVDAQESFVTSARSRFFDLSFARFIKLNFEGGIEFNLKADILVNAFNFFELPDLASAMRNARQMLKPGGRLIMSTIDKTYLILAMSENSEEFKENLRLYQDLPGVKYDFQKIDMGNSVSDYLEYPSILYSTEDYIREAKRSGLEFVSYRESVFTGKLVPKIYNHIEFILPRQ